MPVRATPPQPLPKELIALLARQGLPRPARPMPAQAALRRPILGRAGVGRGQGFPPPPLPRARAQR
eukprot:1442298-Alexandrium_andersonii.AAC.1